MESEKKEEQAQKTEEKKLKTDIDQEKTEAKVLPFFEKVGFNTKTSKEFKGEAKFLTDLHYKAFSDFFPELPKEHISRDGRYPMHIFHIINTVYLLKDHNDLEHEFKLKIVELLKDLQHKDGGFVGAPKLGPELLSTYGAVMTIADLGIPEAYDIIDIPKMKNFLLKIKNNIFNNKETASFDKNGNFLLDKENKDGKILYRTAYPGIFQNPINTDLWSLHAALTVASILNLINFDDIENDPLTKGVVEYVKNCQNYEGGFAPEPFCEAHGGYTYCAVAILVLLKKLNEIDVNALLRYIVSRQMTKEGGFNGRTNKLVDCCYSFWIGSVFNLLTMADKKYYFDDELLYDQRSLQAYILLPCQNTDVGGLRDKPGVYSDVDHTMHGSFALMLSQECLKENQKIVLTPELEKAFIEVNPIYEIPQDKVENAIKYFAEKKCK